MRSLFLIPLFVVFMGFTSGHTSKVQDIPFTVKVAAVKATNKQVDSLYRSKSISLSQAILADFRNNFRQLQNHMDSLNAENIIFHGRLDRASRQRDSITHLLLRVSLENDSLKSSIKEKDESINIMKKAPDYLFFFILVIAANLVGYGIVNTWKNRKQDISTPDNEA